MVHFQAREQFQQTELALEHHLLLNERVSARRLYAAEQLYFLTAGVWCIVVVNKNTENVCFQIYLLL